MKLTPRLLLSMVLVAVFFATTASAQVERVWLTHRSNDPTKVVVNWTTKKPGESVVRFGPTSQHGSEVKVTADRTLHHVEIPVGTKQDMLHYSVQTGGQTSPDAVLKTPPSDVLRIADRRCCRSLLARHVDWWRRHRC